MAPSFPLSVTLGALVGLGLFSLKEFRKYPARKSPLSPSSSPPETSSPGNKVILRSSDGETFVIDEAVASKMAIIKVMLEDGISLEKAILLPNVTGKILAKVIEYCKEHVKDPKFINPILEDELMEFDKKFIKVDERTLHDLILAANYLNVRGLLKLTCQTVADMIKGKTPEEIRKKFNIKYDFSPEEAEEVRKENIWKFE